MRFFFDPSLLGPIKSVMKITENITLPCLNFTIWLGWITGLIITRSPKNVREIKTWIALHTVFPLTLSSCIAIYATDMILNLMPANIKKDFGGNFISAAVGNGFAVGNIVSIAILRLYFLLNAKQVSAFLEIIKNSQHNPYTKICNSKSGIFLLGLLVINSTEFIGLSYLLHRADKTLSWFSSLGEYFYTIVGGATILCPAFMTHVVAFGMALTTLDGLLVMFDEFCANIQTLLNDQGNRQEGLPFERTTQITVRSRKEIKVQEERTMQARFLLGTFQKIQYMFLMYNQVMGPAVLLLTVGITVSAIDGISDFLKPKDAVFKVYTGWLKPLAVLRSVIFLAILDRGHSSKNLVKNRSLIVQIYPLVDCSGRFPHSNFSGFIFGISVWKIRRQKGGFPSTESQ